MAFASFLWGKYKGDIATENWNSLLVNVPLQKKGIGELNLGKCGQNTSPTAAVGISGQYAEQAFLIDPGLTIWRAKRCSN